MAHILILGGGAAGLAAALAAAQAAPAARVTVLERNPKVGKKLLATGNGRCNLDNTAIAPEKYFTADPAALRPLLAAVDAAAPLAWFEQLGLYTRTDEAGRVYPYSNQAADVLALLELHLQRHTVQLRTGCTVSTLRQSKGGYAVQFTNAEGGTESLRADAVICAMGGAAGPQFGTDGSAFALARMLGHSVAEPYPCLVPLRCAGFPVGLKGVRANCALSLYLDGRCTGTERGEVQFAEYGLSGIPAMQLSCLLGPGVKKAGTSVDFFPEMAFPVLRGMLEQRCASGMFASLETLLLGLVAKKLGHAILKSCGLQPLSRAPGSLSRREVNALASALKNWRFAVEGTLPWTQAQVTGGGVPLAEVKTEGCASLRCPGLYLSGEVLDAAGDCGGFNLQWAWATGIAAGRAAARGL